MAVKGPLRKQRNYQPWRLVIDSTWLIYLFHFPLGSPVIEEPRNYVTCLLYSTDRRFLHFRFEYRNLTKCFLERDHSSLLYNQQRVDDLSQAILITHKTLRIEKWSVITRHNSRTIPPFFATNKRDQRNAGSVLWTALWSCNVVNLVNN